MPKPSKLCSLFKSNTAKYRQGVWKVLKSNLSACSAPPTNVQLLPSTLYTAAFSMGQVVEKINFTCTASGGPPLRYSWAETIAGVTTNITSQAPGTGGKMANGSQLTIIPQKLVSSQIQVTCRVVNPNIPSSFPSRAGQAMSNYSIKGELDIQLIISPAKWSGMELRPYHLTQVVYFKVTFKKCLPSCICLGQ